MGRQELTAVAHKTTAAELMPVLSSKTSHRFEVALA